MELSGQLHASSTLLPGKQSLVHIGWGAWWAPESVWTRWWREKFPAHPRSGTPNHPALYHWAIPAPLEPSWEAGQKPSRFYGTLRLISVITDVHHFTLSCARWIQFTPSSFVFRIHLNIILPSTPASPSFLFPSGFPTQILNAFLVSSMKKGLTELC